MTDPNNPYPDAPDNLQRLAQRGGWIGGLGSNLAEQAQRTAVPTASPFTPAANPWEAQTQGLFDQMRANMQGMQDDREQRRGQQNQIFDTLMQRAQQSTIPDRNDPHIRAQADSFSAQQTRAQRDHLANVAEQRGPLANLRGEQRMASERAGQASGAFEAELMGREIATRRQEIANALQTMGASLSDQQRMALLQEQATLDRAMQMQEHTDKFGFQVEDRSAYWDALRRGQFRA